MTTTADRSRSRPRGFLVVGRRWRGPVRVVLLLALGGVVATIVTLGILRFLNLIVKLAGIAPELVGLVIAVALPVAALLMLALFLIPVHVIPTIALVILGLFPMRFIPSDGPFNALPPLAILMGIWVFRRVVLAQTPPGDEPPRSARPSLAARYAIGAVAVVLTVWLILSSALEGGSDTTVGWTVAFVTSVLLPLVVPDARAEARLLSRALLVVGVLVGLYLIGESVLRFSPLYGAPTEEFIFSVYRARAAFSHPLFASAFMTIPAMVGIGAWLQSGRWWPLVAGLVSAAGAVVTVSRGSVVAIAVAVGLAVLIAPFFIGWAHVRRWLLLLVVTAVGAVGVLNFGPLVERSDSIESRISADVRDRAFDVTVQSANYSGWIGTGPGTSGVTSRLFDTIIIENSIFQLVISIGIPGLLLFALLMAALLWRAWSGRNLGAIMAMVAYVVAISGFNSLDAVRSMHILLGFLVILAIHGGGADAAGRPRTKDAVLLDEGWLDRAPAPEPEPAPTDVPAPLTRRR